MRNNEYSSGDFVVRVKDLLRAKQITQSQLIQDLTLADGSFNNWKKSMPRTEIIAKIADYLGVSVDYLLGRSENNMNNSSKNTINQSNAKGDVDANININAAPTVNVTPKSDTLIEEFLQAFNKLSLEKKIDVIKYALDLGNSG